MRAAKRRAGGLHAAAGLSTVGLCAAAGLSAVGLRAASWCAMVGSSEARGASRSRCWALAPPLHSSCEVQTVHKGCCGALWGGGQEEGGGRR